MGYEGGSYCWNFSSLIYKQVNHKIVYRSFNKTLEESSILSIFVEKVVIRELVEGSF